MDAGLLKAVPGEVVNGMLWCGVDVIFICGVEMVDVVVMLARWDIALVDRAPGLFEDVVKLGRVRSPGPGWLAVGTVGGAFECSKRVGTSGTEDFGEGFGAGRGAIKLSFVGFGKRCNVLLFVL